LTQQATEEAVNTWMRIFAETISNFLKSDRLSTTIAESVEKQIKTSTRITEGDIKGKINLQENSRRNWLNSEI